MAVDPVISRLSVYTIVGSICASVLATAIIGGAAGLLQVPTIARDVEALKQQQAVAFNQYVALSERVRSSELVADAATRRANELATVTAAVDARREKQAEQAVKFEQTYVYEHAALEGRSKDRNTEAMGAINALRANDQSVRDRLEALSAAVAQVRANLFDLAYRYGQRPLVERQSAPVPTPQQQTPYMPQRQPGLPEPHDTPSIQVRINDHGWWQLQRRDQAGNATEEGDRWCTPSTEWIASTAAPTSTAQP